MHTHADVEAKTAKKAEAEKNMADARPTPEEKARRRLQGQVTTWTNKTTKSTDNAPAVAACGEVAGNLRERHGEQLAA